jgi:hypothetical protein
MSSTVVKVALVGEPRARSRAELLALVDRIALLLHEALYAAVIERFVDRGVFVTKSDGLALIDGTKEIARERARNIVTGCVDLGEHDAWLGVMGCILVGTQSEYGGAPLPANAGSLADEIVSVLLSDGASAAVAA